MTSKKKVKPPAEDGILFEAFVEKFLVHLEKLGSSRASVFWYALDLGIWEGLTEDHGVSSGAKEIEITVDAVKKVA